MDYAINLSVSFRFFTVVVHGTLFSIKRVLLYVLSSKIIMVQSYVLFSQAKYPKKGILLDET
jgi:hypothetical protein